MGNFTVRAELIDSVVLENGKVSELHKIIVSNGTEERSGTSHNVEKMLATLTNQEKAKKYFDSKEFDF